MPPLQISPQISSGTLTNVPAPILTGTAETGDTVTLSIGGATYATVATGQITATYNITGSNFTSSQSAPYPTLNVSFTVTFDDGVPVSQQTTGITLNGSTITPASPLSFTYIPGVDTLIVGGTAATVTTADPASPDFALIIGNASDAATFSITSFTYSTGSGAVFAAQNTGPATATVTPGTGLWSVDLATATPTSGALALNTNGPNPVTASAMDPGGHPAPAAATQTLTIDTTAPIAPAITSPAFTIAPAPTLTGTAETGDTVTVAIAGATYVTTATTAGWSVNLSSATPARGTLALNTNGPNPVAVSAIDPAGNAAPTTARQTLTIFVPAAAPTAAPALTPASDSGIRGDRITNVTTPTLTGTATPGSTVRLYDAGTTVLGTAIANGGGAYSVTSSALAQGPHTLTVRALDLGGNLGGPSPALTLIIDTDTPRPQILTASAGNRVIRNGVTNLSTPTLTGSAETGSLVTLYDGATPLGTTAAAQNGAWSITPGTLADGPHQLTAIAIDPAANTSLPSQAFALTVETKPPPVTAALLNDTGSSSSDRITADATLGGTGEPGVVVTFSEAGVTLGTTAANAQGVWSFSPQGLAVGVHQLVMSATDAAGNATTVQFGFRLDAQAAMAPADTMPLNATSVGMARFFDSVAGTQFYTSSLSEYNAILASRPDLKPEHNDLNALNPNTVATDVNAVPIYRFFDTRFGTHFFTASGSERDNVIATRADLKFEGVGFFEHVTQQSSDTPVYRFFDSKNGTHFYTTSQNERGSILSTRPDLIDEGIGFYAPKSNPT